MISPAAIKRLQQVLFSPPPGEVSYDLYAILDGAAVRKLPDAFEEHGLAHGCLFRGESEPAILVRAPWLARVEPDSPVLEWLAHEGWGKNWGVFALVPKDTPFDAVLRHFREFTQVGLPDGRIVFFRFYDPRILRLFLPTCDAAQNGSFFALPGLQLLCESMDPDVLLQHTAPDGNATVRKVPLTTGPLAPNL